MASSASSTSTTSKPNKPSSNLPNLLTTLANLTLSTASIAPIFLLKTPPTRFGWSLFAVSSLSLLSSSSGLCPNNPCFSTFHVSALVASSLGQALAFLSLLMRPGASLCLIETTRGPRMATALVRVEGVLFLGLFVVQFLGLVLACARERRCWVREFDGLGEEREGTGRRWWRGRRMARVQVEVGVERMEVEGGGGDGKGRGKFFGL
ncbi:hypothetical protein QJS04_geneDACA013480 [Acorus gramineus]|uniref:Uncharacterized protein n=1 Tax=Acorus gramineus TaxID=55184 RepID=A0AAV9AFU6_ACOGR|nr:hypothetical protein QJS04_geneDACA013480 [Acorus gramineus]